MFKHNRIASPPVYRASMSQTVSSFAGRLAAGVSNRQRNLNGICRFSSRLSLVYLVFGLAFTGGCGKQKPTPTQGATAKSEVATPRTNGKAAEDKKAELPGAVRGTGWHIPWYAPDPKHPNGPVQRVLVADAKQGAMDSDKNFARVRLTDVHATLYHEGKPSATLDAPHVTTNEHDRVIVATGGVTIHALISPRASQKRVVVPPDSTVTADKVVWDSHRPEVVCTGHARLTSKQPGSPAIESYSEKIIYNTETGDMDFRYNPLGK